MPTVWQKNFAGVYFYGLVIFCVLGELIFVIRTVNKCREGILKVYLTTIRQKLEYGVQVWQDILSNKLESIKKGHYILSIHAIVT